MSKKKAPNRPAVITLRLPPEFAARARVLCAKLEKSAQYGHRKWGLSDLAREGLALAVAELGEAE